MEGKVYPFDSVPGSLQGGTVLVSRRLGPEFGPTEAQTPEFGVPRDPSGVGASDLERPSSRVWTTL